MTEEQVFQAPVTKIHSLLYIFSQSWTRKLKFKRKQIWSVIQILHVCDQSVQSWPYKTLKCIRDPAKMSAGESMIMNDKHSQWFSQSSVTTLLFFPRPFKHCSLDNGLLHFAPSQLMTDKCFFSVFSCSAIQSSRFHKVQELLSLRNYRSGDPDMHSCSKF